MSGHSASTPPDLKPVPQDVLGRWPNNDEHWWQKLNFVNHESGDMYAPYTWGFTIYNGIPSSTPGASEMFATGVQRVEAWMRFNIRQAPYDCIADAPYISKSDTQYTSQGIPPPPPEEDELAVRLWNELVEDYPGRGEVVSGPSVAEGDEDFEPVCHAFLDWAARNVKPEHKNALYVRNDHCLIIDEMAVRSLEKLPADPPQVGPVTKDEYDRRKDAELDAWVWLVDRDYSEAWFKWLSEDNDEGINVLPGARDLDDDEEPVPPWIRIHLGELTSLWFMRPAELTIPSWDGVAQRDRDKYNEVFTWSGSGHNNFSLRVYRHFQRENGRQPTTAEYTDLYNKMNI